MDIEGLQRLLRRIEAGEVELAARDVVEPSPLAHEILKAQPYAYLDDAPLEERRTQAVALRRWLDPETAADLGALDAGAIVRASATRHSDVPVFSSMMKLTSQPSSSATAPSRPANGASLA